MADRCPTDVYYEFHGMEQRNYNPIEIARQYAPKFDKPVVDMVEVVRCKDCKHYKQSAVADRKMCFRKDVDGVEVCYDFQPYDSCTYGERKESDNADSDTDTDDF